MKTKSFILTLCISFICSCNDKNEDTHLPLNPISDLKLSNLAYLDSNIPEDAYNDLTFTNAETGYAVSRLGKIVKTIDGGVTWSLLNSNVNFNLKKIQFVNANIGYIIGGNETGSFLLKTLNAGQTWSIINLNNPENGFPTGMFFKNENEGYITGNKMFIKTTNGGSSWVNVLTNSEEIFNDVMFRDNNYGVATVSARYYYRTINGGQSWQAIDMTNGVNTSNQIYFVSEKTFLKSGNLLIDINQGHSLTLPNPANKLLFLDATKCIGIGQHYEDAFFPYGDILLTNNNWSSFVQKSYQPSTEVMDFTAIAKMSNHKAMIIGTGQLYTKIVILTY